MCKTMRKLSEYLTQFSILPNFEKKESEYYKKKKNTVSDRSV